MKNIDNDICNPKKQSYVILVDENDNQIGISEKIAAHIKPFLHRAFSILIYKIDRFGLTEVLLQQRAHHKYHCGGLWSNTCCSHPMPNEDIILTAQKRLQEEMGFTTPVEEIGSFKYHSSFLNGLHEHEYDHVLIGTTQQHGFAVNPQEVEDCKWVEIEKLMTDIERNTIYTPWLKNVMLIAHNHLNNK